jgi:hypothetical protein
MMTFVRQLDRLEFFLVRHILHPFCERPGHRPTLFPPSLSERPGPPPFYIIYIVRLRKLLTFRISPAGAGKNARRPAGQYGGKCAGGANLTLHVGLFLV